MHSSCTRLTVAAFLYALLTVSGIALASAWAHGPGQHDDDRYVGSQSGSKQPSDGSATIITPESAEFVRLSVQALIGSDEERAKALDFFVKRGELDIVPTLVLIAQVGGGHKLVLKAINDLTGASITNWREAMLWQEANPQIVPHPSYVSLKLRHFANIDAAFMDYFRPDFMAPERMKIRFEEITWGGVKADGISPLDRPKMIAAEDADYLLDDDLVFGVAINGDVRAYPLRIMGWHEMLNDVIGGVPVALAYCTLCGSGILFVTATEGRKEPLIFGSSGLLYRSNKLMFDRGTNSLWNQFTGRPVIGPLAQTTLALKIRPLAITSWKLWKAKHPSSEVLSLETGFYRNYDSGVVYRDYFASPELLFPTIVGDESVAKRKDYVFGVRAFGAARAWPLVAFEGQSVINDRIGSTALVLIGNPATRTVRAYRREAGEHFEGTSEKELTGPGGAWRVSEDFLVGPSGEKRPRIAGHIAYWFAWDGYLGAESTLYAK
ncbi:MAG: DUF3179 domain-containing protein [Ahrensia sp.]|nr:DUF3179 domain-containing protein [Ahrensia sp.]